MKYTALCLLGLKVVSTLCAAVEPNLAAGLARDIPENRAALEAECGELGVMDVPKGVDASHVRHCAGHPSDRERFPDIDGKYPTGWGVDTVNTIAAKDTTTTDDRRDPATVGAGQSEASTPGQLFARACWKGADKWGCSKDGWCWANCVFPGTPIRQPQGEWCWTALINGVGPWQSCKKKEDCLPGKGAACSRCHNSDSCGCGC